MRGTCMHTVTTRQVKGKGRGKLLGYPTVNLVVPPNFSMRQGIYAAWVTIDGKRWQGALHFGPVPTFDQKDVSLEVFLLDATGGELMGTETKDILVEFVQFLREIHSFSSQEDLKAQIAKDVEETQKILNPNL